MAPPMKCQDLKGGCNRLSLRIVGQAKVENTHL